MAVGSPVSTQAMQRPPPDLMATVLLLMISGPWPLFLPWNGPKRGGGGQFPQLTEQLWVSAIL